MIDRQRTSQANLRNGRDSNTMHSACIRGAGQIIYGRVYALARSLSQCTFYGRSLAATRHESRPECSVLFSPSLFHSSRFLLSLFLSPSPPSHLFLSFRLVGARYAIPKIYGCFRNIFGRSHAWNHLPGGHGNFEFSWPPGRGAILPLIGGSEPTILLDVITDWSQLGMLVL